MLCNTKGSSQVTYQKSKFIVCYFYFGLEATRSFKRPCSFGSLSIYHHIFTLYKSIIRNDNFRPVFVLRLSFVRNVSGSVCGSELVYGSVSGSVSERATGSVLGLATHMS